MKVLDVWFKGMQLAFSVLLLYLIGVPLLYVNRGWRADVASLRFALYLESAVYFVALHPNGA